MWPLLTVTIVTLWASAMLDIARHRRRGIFTSAELLCTATLVSILGFIAVAGVGAVFATQWVEAVSRTSLGELRADEPEDASPARAPVFSFGLENASSTISEREDRNRVPR